jgi:hypothetical protein
LTTYMSMNRALNSSRCCGHDQCSAAPTNRSEQFILIRHPKMTNRRCSRPLCSSQRTVGTPDHRARNPMHPKSEETAPAFQRAPIPQDPTACTSPLLQRARS